LSNTFLSRVVAERAALALVNRRLAGKNRLSGLSLAAIERWRGKVSLPATHNVVQALMRLSEVAQLLSNKSNESFTPLTAEMKAKLDKLMNELAASVDVLPSEG